MAIGKANPTFWTLLGIGILALLLAGAWRVVTGAELEAKGKEWSLKIIEAADSVDEARKQLETEARRLKEEAAKREQYWSEQLTEVRASCPKAAKTKLPPPPVLRLPEKTLADVAKNTEAARNVARDVANMRFPRF